MEMQEQNISEAFFSETCNKALQPTCVKHIFFLCGNFFYVGHKI